VKRVSVFVLAATPRLLLPTIAVDPRQRAINPYVQNFLTFLLLVFIVECSGGASAVAPLETTHSDRRDIHHDGLSLSDTQRGVSQSSQLRVILWSMDCKKISLSRNSGVETVAVVIRLYNVWPNPKRTDRVG
jgi:hypothetical protein